MEDHPSSGSGSRNQFAHFARARFGPSYRVRTPRVKRPKITFSQTLRFYSTVLQLVSIVPKPSESIKNTTTSSFFYCTSPNLAKVRGSILKFSLLHLHILSLVRVLTLFFSYVKRLDARSRAGIGAPILIHKKGSKVVGLHCNPVQPDLLLSCGNDHLVS